MLGRFDVLGRAAYGLLCIAGMALEAIPVLLAVGVIGGIGIALDGNGDRALWVWLGSWAAAGFAGVLFAAITYGFWPLASDWIIEWPGYVTAFAIGGAGLGFMALTVFVTDWPLALEVLIPLAATFVAGFCVPGRFLGLRAGGLPARAAKEMAPRR
jgi:hypothetical protein